MFWSPLAKLIRRRTNDPLRSESLFIAWASVLALILLLANQASWSLVRADILAEPDGALALKYWLSQLTGLLLFVGCCVVGFKSKLTITFAGQNLQIKRGKAKQHVELSEINEISIISDMKWHRHYRRYLKTTAWFNKRQDEYILLITPAGPVILGLPKTERKTLFVALNLAKKHRSNDRKNQFAEPNISAPRQRTQKVKVA